MSNYRITNTTNGNTNTFPTTFEPGNTVVTGYKQAGSNIIFASLVDSTIEGTTTGYKSSGTDIGNSFCAIYNNHTGPSTGTINVANYSTCTIVMCGGGGGGGGGSRFNSVQQPGGIGGNGGITIIKNIDVSSLTTISYQVGRAGNAGLGEQNETVTPTAQRASTAGGSGIATNVVISPTTYTANGGGGGSNGQPLSNGADGTISPTTQNYSSATLNGPLTYQTTPDRVINISSTNYGQGGSGGTSTPSRGNDGQAGRPGYLRVYLYP